MAEYTTIKLVPDQHLLLDQPLLRLPYELSRNNFKTAQRHIEQNTKQVTDVLSNGAKIVTSAADPAKAALSTIDQALTKLVSLKRKLSALNESTVALNQQAAARLSHLESLHSIPNLAEPKYEDWSRVRLDRLLVDALLRMGYTQSARELAENKQITKLVDLEEFENVRRIETSLREEKRVDVALSWCAENKQGLKKMNSQLEFELRLQQFIELARQREQSKLVEAVVHARKYLTGAMDTSLGSRAAGLLAFPPDTEFEPYKTLYSDSRWQHLAHTFVETHHNLYTLPAKPLLDIALSAGLSALKTPACHSSFISPSSGLNTATSPLAERDDPTADASLAMSIDSLTALRQDTDPSTLNVSMTTSVCPICSMELNRLARHVPYAHHSKSHVESDAVVLPNGRIYGLEKLNKINEKLGTPQGYVRDPVETGLMFETGEIKKVFIS